MGASGWSISIEPIPARRQRELTTLRRAVLSDLRASWKMALPGHFFREAVGWVSVGDASLLTVEVTEREISFQLSLSVTWPVEVAEHWFQLALWVSRSQLKSRLQLHGYRLTRRSWFPTPQRIDGRFFVDGKRLGSVEGDSVTWHLPDAAQQPLQALGPKVQARALAARDGFCSCPVCLFCDWRAADWSGFTGWAPWRAAVQKKTARTHQADARNARKRAAR